MGHGLEPSEKQRAPTCSPLDRAVSALGHEVHDLAKGWQKCFACNQRWHKRHRTWIADLGNCFGTLLDIPARVRNGSQFIWAGGLEKGSH